MYLKLSNDLVLPAGEIVGVFDFDNCTTGRRTLPLLERAQREGRLDASPGELPRSFILLCGEGGWRVVLSPVTSATLRRRIAGEEG